MMPASWAVGCPACGVWREAPDDRKAVNAILDQRVREGRVSRKEIVNHTYWLVSTAPEAQPIKAASLAEAVRRWNIRTPVPAEAS
jgi:hypothetical protein